MDLDVIKELSNYLDHFSLGDAVKLIFVLMTTVVTVTTAILKIVKKIKKDSSDATIKQIEDEKLRSTMENIKKDIDGLEESLHEYQMISSETLSSTSMRVGTIEKDIKSKEEYYEKRFQYYDKFVNEVENRLKDIKISIELLMESDVHTQRAFIMREYNRCVKEEKCIDLLTLQNVESIYKKLLEEDPTPDQFITKLVTEMRNLPTKTE